MKNILFVTPYLYPEHIGGVEVFNYNLINELSEHANITYLSYCDIDNGRTVYASLNLFKGKLNFLIEKIVLLRNIFKKDIIILSFMKSRWHSWILYPIFRKIFGIRYLIIIHGGGLTPWKVKWPFVCFFKNAYKIIGVSEAICEEYSKRANVEIELIPPLIPFEANTNSKECLRDNYKIDKSAFVFLYVGSLRNLKKPMAILKAAKNLSESYLKEQKVKVLFLGDGPLYNEMRDYVYSNLLVNYVELVGNVPQDQINQYYKLSDCYIISSDFEGTSISLLEAMYNKLPILAANSRGINSIINDQSNGLLFNNNDSMELSKLMKYAIENPEKIKELAAKAYNDFQEHYDYEKILNRYKELIGLI